MAESGLQPEGRHPARGVAASDFRPLCNIPHCCLPQESGPYLSPNVAGRPLRPATRRRLGRPLPHQQADRTRAHPQPKKLSNPKDASRAEYPVLANVSIRYPKVRGRLLTRYSPVRHSCTPERALPFDLHVLSTPPAFVLSQDQTLHRKNKKSDTPTNTGAPKNKFDRKPNHQQTPTTHTTKCAHCRGKSIKGKNKKQTKKTILGPSPKKMALT